MKDVKMEVVMVMMMIWMIRTDEHHAPFVTMTWPWCHLIFFVLKHFKCKQYFTFSPSVLFFFKYFGCKFKTLKHIKELRPPNFNSGLILFCTGLFQLNTTELQPSKIFQIKILASGERLTRRVLPYTV